MGIHYSWHSRLHSMLWFVSHIFNNLIGFHRKLATHITKVKSVNLDKWTRGQIELYKAISIFYIALCMIDNEIANDYWEYKLPAGFKRPVESSDPSTLWKFINDKYVKKLFAPKDAIDPVKEYYNSTIIV